MSEPSSVAAGHASLAASSTGPTSAALEGMEHGSNGPSSDPNNSGALTAMEVQQKYAEERAKRVRDDGLSQYVDLSRSEKFRHFQDDPWIGENPPDVEVPALKDGASCKYLILGAGYGGLVFAVRLIQAGISVGDIRLVDSAGGFGGTWYWNRYPGLMCDVESYIYMPLLEEMEYMPKHKYAYGTELREYADKIADKFELRGRTLFRAEVKSLTWDDDQKEWVVKITQKRPSQEESNISVRAHVVISTSGLLNSPKVPVGLGVEDFQGHAFHTSRWDYAYTGGSPMDPSLANLKDKRVGIIGTGATAVQAVPHLGKWAKELYVFQRTPSAVDERGQHATDAQWWAREMKGKKGWQRRRNENFCSFLINDSPLPKIDMVADGWTKMPSYSALTGGPAKVVTGESIPAHVGSLHALDFPRQQRLRDWVDEVVKDKDTAQKLKAWYPGWCKRPCFHDDYLPTFNLPNVTLVDTDGRGVDCITENGVVVGGTEYKLDLLILGTGFRSPGVGSPAFRAGMSVTGRNGLSLDKKWTEGVGTLHGVNSHGFPNLFWPGPLQAGAVSNQCFLLDNLATHIAYIVSESERRATQGQPAGQKFTIEPTVEAEEEWSMQVLMRAAAFAGLANCTPGYLNLEGEFDRMEGQEERMQAARGVIWGEGILSYLNVIEGWRSQGNLRGLAITAAA